MAMQELVGNSDCGLTLLHLQLSSPCPNSFPADSDVRSAHLLLSRAIWEFYDSHRSEELTGYTHAVPLSITFALHEGSRLLHPVRSSSDYESSTSVTEFQLHYSDRLTWNMLSAGCHCLISTSRQSYRRKCEYPKCFCLFVWF